MPRERFLSLDAAFRQSAMLFGASDNSSSPLSSNISIARMHSASQLSPRVETPTRLSLDGTEDCDPDTIVDGNPLRRLSASLTASSEAVHALFGDGVGPCWGDFSCSHLRIRGRLYLTSQAVLFHTNLLGFERRICLLLRDIVHAELFRTTSIRIHTMDLETYIFKSFNNREQVLHLMNGLKILSDKQQGSRRRASSARKPSDVLQPTQLDGVEPGLCLTQSSSVADSSSGLSRSAFISTVGAPGLPVLSSSPPVSPNRRRASSDSLVRLPLTENATSPALTGPSSLVQWRLEPIESNEELSVHTEQGRLSPPEAGDESPSVAWETIKGSKSQLSDVGIDSLTLQCSLDDYYKTFLVEDAQFSLDYYQKEYVKDQEVEITGWDIGSDGDFRRTITFTHPIKNSLGIGPSSARTSRQQRLRKFEGIGMALENRTFVEGIPAADCFFVQDLWLLEVTNESQLQLSVRYDVKFKKRSIFRNIIQKSVRKETKEWIAGYVDMVQAALRQDTSGKLSQSHESAHFTDVGKLEAVVSQLVTKLDQAYRIIFFLVAVLIVAQLMTSYNVMSLQTCVMERI